MILKHNSICILQKNKKNKMNVNVKQKPIRYLDSNKQ